MSANDTPPPLDLVEAYAEAQYKQANSNLARCYMKLYLDIFAKPLEPPAPTRPPWTTDEKWQRAFRAALAAIAAEGKL